MAVGATLFGVPPGLSASNDSGAAQAGVPPSVPGGMAVGALPVGPINLSDDGPEDENRFGLSEGIQDILLKCIAECSDDQVYWYGIGNSIASEQTEVLQQLQEILMTSRCGPENEKKPFSTTRYSLPIRRQMLTSSSYTESNSCCEVP
jgi:hypothetical protein